MPSVFRDRPDRLRPLLMTLLSTCGNASLKLSECSAAVAVSACVFGGLGTVGAGGTRGAADPAAMVDEEEADSDASWPGLSSLPVPLTPLLGAVSLPHAVLGSFERAGRAGVLRKPRTGPRVCRGQSIAQKCCLRAAATDDKARAPALRIRNRWW